MAKVKGPLMSMEASGSIAGAITFAKWKGQAYVRGLVIPKNNMSEDDGDRRQIFGGIGRAASVVKPMSDYAGQLTTLNRIPAGQSKQSFLVKYIKEAYCSDATAFEAIVTAFNAHGAKSDFTAQAEALGLADLTIAYKGTTSSFGKGVMLYLLAKAAIDLGFTGTPYSVTLSTWVEAQILLLKADVIAA